jgi:hypothetical protein
MLASGGVGLGNRFSSSIQQDWIFMRSLSPGTFDLVVVAGNLTLGVALHALRQSSLQIGWQ